MRIEGKMRDAVICLVLAAATLVVFSDVRHYGFAPLDDDKYAQNNPHISGGFTRANVVYALTRIHYGNWIPLTLFSHMMDCQLFGPDHPGGHHVTNLLLHLANTVLLFLVLKQMTGRVWRSACVAALFAVHPLHVEPVVWIASRKDVLSTLFWILTMGAYTRYARQPGTGRYLAVMALLALGLMSKPMLVTLPFVLLLLDYWPLDRLNAAGAANGWGGRRIGKLVVEKLPFLVLAAGASAMTYVGQSRGAVRSLEESPLGPRISNAIVSYVRYIAKTVWPNDLAVYYPLEPWMWWQVLGAGLILAALTWSVWRLRRWPYVAVGWLWYLGSLVPVIGVVQIGGHAMADRFTYVPLIGLFLVVAWGLPDLLAQWRYAKAGLVVVTTGTLLLLIFCSWSQVRYWRDGVTLLEHAIAVTSNNALAHNNLGHVLRLQSKRDEAKAQFEEALAINPESVMARTNLADCLVEEGRIEEAESRYREALRLRPDYPKAHNNLGVLLARQGRLEDAIEEFSQGVALEPENAEAQFNLAWALFETGQMEEAASHFEAGLERDPANAPAQIQLGTALANQGKLEEAVARYREALRVNPNSDLAHVKLGTALGKLGRLVEATERFTKAIAINPDNGEAHFNLGSALLAQGQLDAAAAQFIEALRIWPDNALAHMQLGTICERQGKLDEALEHFSRALALMPDDAVVRNYIERLKAQLNTLPRETPSLGGAGDENASGG